MDEKTLRRLLDKYLAGTCTEEEKGIVETWYNDFERRADAFAALSENQREELRRIMLSGIKKKIRRHESTIVRPLNRWYYYVAGLVAMLLIATVFNVQKRVADPKTAAVKMITELNSKKSMLRVSLPDSTTVWLQPGAEITYPEHFVNPRVVSMKGDVFFDVKPDASNPFFVHSAKMITKVLGTSFRIRAFGHHQDATVSVLTGKVSVQRIYTKGELQKKKTVDASEILLLPDEKVLLSEGVLMMQKALADGELDIWRKSSMAFDNVEMRQVLAKLNTAFDVKIEASHAKINGYLLKADFTGMNLPDILEMLTTSLDLTYEMRDNGIILKPIDI